MSDPSVLRREAHEPAGPLDAPTDARSDGTPSADGDARTAPPALVPLVPHPELLPRTDPAPAPDHPARTALAVLTLGLLLLLVLAVTAAAYLYGTSMAWQDRAETYLETSRTLGQDLATARGELAGARSELAAVRGQLTTAQTRIIELADEKARVGDDREVQRQLVDYQVRVNEAARRVALALDECVQGQNQFIGYLQEAERYDAVDLAQFGADVQALCQAATEANIALQRELSP